MSTDNPTPAPNGVSAPENAGANGAVQAPASEKKLSNAELKKQKQAEKQARRAQQKKETDGDSEQQKPQPSSPKPQQQSQKKQSTPKNTPEKQPSSPKAQQQPQQGSKPRRPSGSQQMGLIAPTPKQVGLFGHLYGQPRRHNLQGAGRDIHPAILALGLQMSSYEICGSNARCVAMLLAFKCV